MEVIELSKEKGTFRLSLNLKIWSVEITLRITK